jgi:hypothetical protein
VTGLIVLKALAAEPSLMPQAQATMAASKCNVLVEEPQPKQVAPPPRMVVRGPRISSSWEFKLSLAKLLCEGTRR